MYVNCLYFFQTPVIRPCVPEVSLILEEEPASRAPKKQQAPPVQRLYQDALSKPPVSQATNSQSHNHVNPVSLPVSPNTQPNSGPCRSQSLPNVRRVYNAQTGQYDMVVTPPSSHQAHKPPRKSKGHRQGHQGCRLPCCNQSMPVHQGQFYQTPPYGHFPQHGPIYPHEMQGQRLPYQRTGSYPPQFPQNTPPQNVNMNPMSMPQNIQHSYPGHNHVVYNQNGSPVVYQSQAGATYPPAPNYIPSAQTHVNMNRPPQPNIQNTQPSIAQTNSSNCSTPVNKSQPPSPSKNGQNQENGTTSHNTSTSTLTEAPADVYELIRKQDEELKMLRSQLSQLLAKQNLSTESGVSSDMHDSSTEMSDPRVVATQTSMPSTPQAKAKNMCSIAVNTSLWWPAEKPSEDISQHNTQGFFKK